MLANFTLGSLITGQDCCASIWTNVWVRHISIISLGVRNCLPVLFCQLACPEQGLVGRHLAYLLSHSLSLVIKPVDCRLTCVYCLCVSHEVPVSFVCTQINSIYLPICVAYYLPQKYILGALHSNCVHFLF